MHILMHMTFVWWYSVVLKIIQPFRTGVCAIVTFYLPADERECVLTIWTPTNCQNARQWFELCQQRASVSYLLPPTNFEHTCSYFSSPLYNIGPSSLNMNELNAGQNWIFFVLWTMDILLLSGFFIDFTLMLKNHQGLNDYKYNTLCILTK